MDDSKRIIMLPLVVAAWVAVFVGVVVMIHELTPTPILPDSQATVEACMPALTTGRVLDDVDRIYTRHQADILHAAQKDGRMLILVDPRDDRMWHVSFMLYDNGDMAWIRYRFTDKDGWVIDDFGWPEYGSI